MTHNNIPNGKQFVPQLAYFEPNRAVSKITQELIKFKRVTGQLSVVRGSLKLFKLSIIYCRSHKIEVAMKSSGDRKSAISVPPGGSGKLYGIVVVPESCPRGKSSFMPSFPSFLVKLIIPLKINTTDRVSLLRATFSCATNDLIKPVILRMPVIVTNVCQFENGRCNKDQLCLPDGQGGRSCVCADDATGPCEDTH